MGYLKKKGKSLCGITAMQLLGMAHGYQNINTVCCEKKREIISTQK